MGKEKKKRNFSSTVWILVALIAGIIVGLIMPDWLSGPFSFFTSVYMNALQMMIYPLVFCSIVIGIVGIGNLAKTGKITVQALIWFTGTTALAAAIGLFVPRFLHLGVGAKVVAQDYKIEAASLTSISDTLKNIIPANPLKAFTDGNMLQVLVFAVFIGVACLALKEKAKPVADLCQAVNDISIWIVTKIMLFIPLGIFCSISNTIHACGAQTIIQLGGVMLAMYITFILYVLIIYGGMVKFIGHYSPVKFFHDVAPAALNAFATCSSNATLPLSMECATKNVGIPYEIASLTLPLGATINMDAVSIAMSFMLTFFSNALGIPLSVGTMVTLLAANVLLSIGTPGIPNGAIAAFAALAPMAGLPVNQILAMYASVNTLADMGATCVNVLGDLACSTVLKYLLRNDIPTREEKEAQQEEEEIGEAD